MGLLPSKFVAYTFSKLKATVFIFHSSPLFVPFAYFGIRFCAFPDSSIYFRNVILFEAYVAGTHQLSVSLKLHISWQWTCISGNSTTTDSVEIYRSA